MNKYLLKGLAVCTFLCTVIAFPSLSDVCFLPSGICDQDARPAESEGGALTCDDYKAAGNYFDAPVEGRACTKVNVPLDNCDLWDCPAGNCRAQGYDLGPTYSDETRPLGRQDTEAWDCKPCKQGSQYWWTCDPLPCADGYMVQDENTCKKEEGKHWVEVETHKSGARACGECVENKCNDNETDVIPSGCMYCTEERAISDTTTCYICHRMNEDFVTEEEKNELGIGCYKFDVTVKAADGQTCYKKEEVTCGDDQYLLSTTLEGGTKKCSCEDCTYTFTADKEMHYTAAGGEKDNNVISKRKCEKESDWPKWSPTSSEVIGCTIAKSDDGELKVTCPPNKTAQEKRGTFVLRQIKNDGVTVSSEITVTVIIDPDTCANPAQTTSCGKAGFASFDKGPNPACYETHLDSACPDGYVSMDSGLKSVADQTCYYCIKNTCPTKDFILGETPDPVEGYDTEKTDADNNCYKIKPCPEGFSTDYQTDKDCGQHPEGWIFEKGGMSGDKVCGKCTPKKCTGADFVHKCEAQPRCANEADNSCGYKDLNKKNPDSIEYEGDTPKYNCNDKECPNGTSTKETEGCGTNIPTEYRSGENICYKYKDPEPCPEDHTRADDCSCVCTKTCGDGYELDSDKCECKPLCTPGDGFFGSVCCQDTDCKSSDEFPLYCFKKGTELQGNCYECDTVEDCVFTDKPGDKFFTKYGAGVTKYPGYAKNANGEYEYEGDRGKPDYTDRDKCIGGECILKEPEPVRGCSAGDGDFGSACCEDKDCGSTSEYQLYCFNTPSEDGTSAKSCRECGAFSDCELFHKDMSRFEQKCAVKADYCTQLADKKYTYKDGKDKTSLIWDTGSEVVVNHSMKADGSWSSGGYYTTLMTGNSQKRFSCRYGECATYDASYEYNATKEAEDRGSMKKNGYSEDEIQEAIDNKYNLANSIAAVGGKTSDDDSKCPSGSSKAYPKGCSADEAVVVGKTPFGSFCWACPKK